MKTVLELAEREDLLSVNSHEALPTHHSFQEVEEFIEEDLG
jgi:hypothetical protein